MSKKYWKFFAEKTASDNEKLSKEKKILTSSYYKIALAFIFLGILAIWIAYF